MHRLLETIFRYPLRLVTILILLPIIGVALAYFLVPHSYEAAARLWAYQRFGVITAAGTESNLFETPAQTQATALTELLNTRSFALSVAQGTNLVQTLHLSSDVISDPDKLNSAIFANISNSVVVTPVDYSLYTITYTNHSAQVAQAIVASVVNQFSTQGIHYAYGDAQRLLNIYDAQLIQAQQQATQALTAEQDYLKEHPTLTQPGVSPMNDPQYAALDAQRQNDQANVQNIQANINELNQQLKAEGTNLQSFFKEVDNPLVPTQPESRTKQFLTAGGAGLAVGLVACLTFLLILMRRDKAIYMARDIEKLATLPVVMEIPQLPAKTVKRLAEHSI